MHTVWFDNLCTHHVLTWCTRRVRNTHDDRQNTYARRTLTTHRVSYYNPQRDDWTPELVTTEANVKETAKILMFVIESSTRALVSVLESVEHICRGRRCFIVMKEMGETPLDFDGKGTECRMVHRCNTKIKLCPTPPFSLRGMNLCACEHAVCPGLFAAVSFPFSF